MTDDTTALATVTHLWDVDHPYYCNEATYFDTKTHNEFGSWETFLSEWGQSDPEYNLLVRWDWRTPENEWVEPGASDELFLAAVIQRKGFLVTMSVKVRREDEDSVRTWLLSRWKHLHAAWEPLTAEPPASAGAHD